MTWDPPIDPPADGSSITRPFYITYVKDNLSHLRVVTGGDPVGAGYVLTSTGAGVGGWNDSPSLASLALSGVLAVDGAVSFGSTLGVAGAFTAPSATISGAITVGSVASSGAVSGTTFSASAAAGFIFASAEGASTDYLYESGSHTPAIAVSNVQIQRWLAGTTVITAATQITGQVTITGSGTYTGTWAAASDRRLKTAIQPVQNALASVLALKPITYRPSKLYRQLYGGAELESGRYQGLIAQDVQTVFPDVVTMNKDDNNMLAVDYARLVVPLVSVAQELWAMNQALAARVAALESRP